MLFRSGCIRIPAGLQRKRDGHTVSTWRELLGIDRRWWISDLEQAYSRRGRGLCDRGVPTARFPTGVRALGPDVTEPERRDTLCARGHVVNGGGAAQLAVTGRLEEVGDGHRFLIGQAIASARSDRSCWWQGVAFCRRGAPATGLSLLRRRVQKIVDHRHDDGRTLQQSHVRGVRQNGQS